VTTPIVRIIERGILTSDGVEHDLDMLVLATGYHMCSDPESYKPGTIVGRDGFDLSYFFNERGLQAYESVAIPRLPNRWILVGPYSWTGTSWQYFVEMTADHAVRAITEARKRGATTVEVTEEAHDAYHAEICRRDRIIRYYYNVQNAGLRTYYVNSHGDVPLLRPSGVFEAKRRSRHFPLEHYQWTQGQRVAIAARPDYKAKDSPSTNVALQGNEASA
jgi:hypothetical protein